MSRAIHNIEPDTALEKQSEVQRKELSEIISKIDSIKAFQEEANILTEKINSFNVRIAEFRERYGIVKEFNFIFTSPSLSIADQLSEEILRRDKLKNSSDDASHTIDSITVKIQEQRDILSVLIADAGKVEEIYQKYLADVEDWEKTKKLIVGDIQQDGSISYLEHELEILGGAMREQYHQLCENRKLLIKELFQQKQLIANVYKEIYQPIERELYPLLQSSEETIMFDVNINLIERNFGKKLLEYIDQRAAGTFARKEGQDVMQGFIESTNFNDVDSIIDFIEKILQGVNSNEDFDAASKRIKSNKTDFYTLLTSLDYIDAEYNLSLGGRNLQLLSAGERGIVLMVFYLALSKNDIPLIIDQPEDNLDNQSVFSRLVPCIRKAKEKRQVIIVTHNPNIAIACDAEQIVCCSIDKNNNHIGYESGSIENSEIRAKVIDILEGTMPAFELRRLKYTYERYGQ